MGTWTLTHGSSSRSLDGWGIVNPRLSLRSLAVDEFTFRIPRADTLATPDFAPDDLLSLKLDGVQKFRGTVTKAFAYGAGGSSAEEGDEYTVSGPWFQLEQIVYQQPRKIGTIATEVVTGYASFNTSHVTLGQDIFGQKISCGAQIRAINLYAAIQGAGYLQGIAPDFLNAPLDVCRDITCAEAIKRCLNLQPDAVAWFDYSTAVPILNIQARALLTPISINISAGTSVASFRATARKDLVPAGVVFNYMTTKEATTTIGSDTETRVLDQVTQDVAGLGEGIRVVVATIDLSRDASGNYEAAPIGLAGQYFSLLSVTPWEGNLRLLGVDPVSSPALGNVVNFTGGRAAWSSMRAIIQTASYDLAAGAAEFEFGPPEHLSPQDFVNMLMFNRRSAAPAAKSAFPQVQPDGSAAHPGDHTNGNAGVHPKTAETRGNLGTGTPIRVCDDDTGIASTINVLKI